MTFLFTDVEGSTRRWEADAESMRAAVAAHYEVLRRAIEAHGGWLFKQTGDGVCASRLIGATRDAVMSIRRV
jgi:class 3 adenylate cyclase